MAATSDAIHGVCTVAPRIVRPKEIDAYYGGITVRIVRGISEEQFLNLSRYFFPRDTWQCTPSADGAIRFRTGSLTKEAVQKAIKAATSLMQERIETCVVLNTEEREIPIAREGDRISEELPPTLPLSQ